MIRILIRGTVAIVTAAILAGCASTDGTEPVGGSFATATAQASAGPKTVDPAYSKGVRAPRSPRESDVPMEDFYRRAAEIAISEGKTYGAIAHLSKVIETSPADKKIAYDLARHLRYIGALSDAEGALNSALTIHPSDMLLKLEFAKVRIAQGRAKEALVLLRSLHAESPQDPSILQAFAVAQDRSGDHSKAQRTYAKAIRLGQPSAALLNNAALSYLMSGDAPRAVSMLRDAAAAPGASVQVRQNLALALVFTGQHDEARQIAEAALPKALADRALGYYQSLARNPQQLRGAWNVAAKT